MLHSFYGPDWPRTRVADLARIVSRIAEEGDPIALRLLHQGAQELALLAASVRRQLWNEEETEPQPVLVSWAGGVFESSTLRERFRMLIALEKDALCEPPRHGPAEGALLLAWQTIGLKPVLKLSPAK
jgi:N-acetylglucosamine kinase-like BadF-type ATPase